MLAFCLPHSLEINWEPRRTITNTYPYWNSLIPACMATSPFVSLPSVQTSSALSGDPPNKHPERIDASSRVEKNAPHVISKQTRPRLPFTTTTNPPVVIVSGLSLTIPSGFRSFVAHTQTGRPSSSHWPRSHGARCSPEASS